MACTGTTLPPLLYLAKVGLFSFVAAELQTFLILGDLGGLSVSACLFTLLLTSAEVAGGGCVCVKGTVLVL